MPHPFALPRRSDRLEILDQRSATAAEIEANFDEIALVNRFLGGIRAVRFGLRQLLADRPQAGCVSILDIATGGADIPRAMVGCARRGDFGAARTLHITATDVSDEVLAYARIRTPEASFSQIAIEAADALELPYGDRSFDFATCSMALHHFDPAAAVGVLQEMDRVSRHGFLVNDLRRSRLAAALIWLITRVLRAAPITRHDAPLSVLRAYTPEEVRGLLQAAGLGGEYTVRREPMFRLLAICRRL